jgi:hypothetical protein
VSVTVEVLANRWPRDGTRGSAGFGVAAERELRELGRAVIETASVALY